MLDTPVGKNLANYSNLVNTTVQIVSPTTNTNGMYVRTALVGNSVTTLTSAYFYADTSAPSAPG